ncbi:hypothetical protein M413DRAFT_444340 [Hebeloma cylindrosporum]|uniref:Uncharacterized protein n=1 Tax=Hebeloma cylindrosporum TaxID=76867 RepID=A0A0C2YNS7_HEBCY|nr:hypothetical protein M413DRAFT_444340 [Hebeloma cylindrosporum h7]
MCGKLISLFDQLRSDAPPARPTETPSLLTRAFQQSLSRHPPILIPGPINRIPLEVLSNVFNLASDFIPIYRILPNQISSGAFIALDSRHWCFGRMYFHPSYGIGTGQGAPLCPPRRHPRSATLGCLV